MPAERRVLLVEDDDVASRALAEILRHFHCHVTIARTVATAVAALSERTFDQAILDLMLPDGNGAEVLTEIRSRGLPMRVIVTTATSDAALISQTKSRNPDAFLAKPLDISKLLGAMQI